jgi:FMN-dependent NADH-azoreductase
MGRTVVLGPNGREGVLKGKRVVVVTSRGGSYGPNSPSAPYDHQEPYLRHILAFVGLTDVTFIHAENQKPGELAEPSRSAAIEQLQLAAAASNRFVVV